MHSKLLSLISDFFILGGIGLMGYGLYLFQPWISYAVVGAVLLLLGLVSALMQGK